MWIKKQMMRRTIEEDEQYTLHCTIPFDKHRIVQSNMYCYIISAPPLPLLPPPPSSKESRYVLFDCIA